MTCPVCGEAVQEVIEIAPPESVSFSTIYYGAQTVCIAEDVKTLYAHGEPL